MQSIKARWSSRVLPLTFCFRRDRGAEGLDAAVFQVILAFGDIAGVSGTGWVTVVAGHGGDAQDGDGARAVEVNGLLIPGSQAAVKSPG